VTPNALSSADGFRLLFAGNPLPMWLYDRESRAFLEVNDAAVAHYGYSRDEFLRMRLDDIYPDGDAGRHRLRDGRVIEVDTAAQAVDFGGRRAALLVVHDLTVRRESERHKRAEEDLHRLNAELEERVRLRTAQLQAAVHELEAFSYSVSHDLRAPLRSIDGFSQALVDDLGPSLPDGAKGHLDRIRAATLRMGQLIDDLLALSNVTRSEMTRERIDVTDLAGRILADLARQSPDRPVRLTIAPGMTASGDPRLLRVALENLLANAWKFTMGRADSCIDVGWTQEGSAAVFFVRDNGAGFDPTYADKLFTPFQRLHASSEFPGTGIGLATVQRIVSRHGGRVRAEGRPGRGACFYFTLE
jgi:signal transduction histidine kinase